MFTSSSVLIHIQNMESEKVKLIAPEGLQSIREALDCGMNLLQTASQSSLLAARYLAMLNHVRAKLDSRALAPGDGQEQENSAVYPSAGDWMPVPASDLDSGLDHSTWQFLGSTEIDLDGLEFDMSLYGF